MPPQSTSPPGPTDGRGLVYGAGAFLFWGLTPLFWKLLGRVPPTEQLAHRVAWCAVMLVGWLGFRGQLGGALRQIAKRRTVATLLATTALIGSNWGLYLLAVASDRILEASLGYFINPLLSVLLGLVVLGERLRRAQWISVALAGIGVGTLVAAAGHLPWLSLGLASTFGLYGLLRKQVPVGPEAGLALETALLSPFAAAFLLSRALAGRGAFGGDPGTDLLLVTTGLVTLLPLVWFTHGARRLPLSTIGLLQYLAPTGQFLLAVFLYHEPFDRSRLAAFVFIWCALALFTFDAQRSWRRAAAPSL